MASIIHPKFSGTVLRRAASCWALSLAALSVVACGELEPMVEPEVADLQLTIETLKTQIRDAQRTNSELRTELEAQRQELADAHVARAQLEGRVREAERRVIEARHVIELQREELLAARSERERISKSSLQLQGQMKQLQKHLSKARPLQDNSPGIAPTSRDGSVGRVQKASVGPTSSEPSVGSLGSRTMMAAGGFPGSAPADPNEIEGSAKGAPVRAVTVSPGDTLWRIAKTFGVQLDQLRSLNRLTDNRIEVGQTLWVPADRTAGTLPGSLGTTP